MKPNVKGMIYVLAASVLWSTAGFFARLIPWDAISLAGWRGVFSTLTIFIFMRCAGLKVVVKKKSLILGVFVALAALLYLLACKLTTAANAIAIQYTAPIDLVILSALFLKKKFRGMDIAAVLCTFAGVALSFMGGFSSEGTWGNVIAVVDGLALGTAYLFMGECDESERMSGIMLGHLATAVIGIPYSFITGVEITAFPLLMAAAMGVFQLGLAYVCFSRALKTCPPIACALLSATEIVLNPLWVWILNGELPGVWSIVGTVLIIITVTVWSAVDTKLSATNSAVQADTIKA